MLSSSPVKQLIRPVQCRHATLYQLCAHTTRAPWLNINQLGHSCELQTSSEPFKWIKHTPPSQRYGDLFRSRNYSPNTEFRKFCSFLSLPLTLSTACQHDKISAKVRKMWRSPDLVRLAPSAALNLAPCHSEYRSSEITSGKANAASPWTLMG